MKKMIARAMLATLALTATTTFVLINQSTQAKAEMKLAYPDGTGGVWNYQVTDYLNTHDHPNSTIYNIDASGNRYSTSPDKPNYYTITHVFRCAINGWEDIPMNY